MHLEMDRRWANLKNFLWMVEHQVVKGSCKQMVRPEFWIAHEQIHKINNNYMDNKMDNMPMVDKVKL